MTKFIQLNGGSPAGILGILQPYLYEQEYDTLKDVVGLTQSQIDNLYEQIVVKGTQIGLEIFLGEGELEEYKARLYGNIDFRSLNIPGDILRPTLVIDNGTIVDGIANAPGIGKVIFNTIGYGKYTLNTDDRPDRGDGQFSYKSLVSFNEKIFGSVRTAPSVNRWWTLWDSYGGFRSIIMRLLVDKQNYYGSFRDPWFLYSYALAPNGRSLRADVADLLRQKKQQAGVQKDYGVSPQLLPFGTQGGGEYGNFWWTKMMATLVWPGWDERGQPFVQPDKVQNSRLINYLNNVNYPLLGSTFNRNRGWDYIRGSYGRTQLGGEGTYINREDIKKVGWGFQGAFSGPFDEDYYDERQSPVRVSTSSGIITVRGVESFPAPWIEFPDVISGNLLRPEKIPLGMAKVYDDLEPLIDFHVELNLHFDAIAEWVEAGCPCDWPDWGDYQDPQTQALEKQQEQVTTSKANQYVPTAVSSPTPPPKPKFGDLWQDTTTGKTKVFVQTSSTTGVWVDSTRSTV